MGFGISSLFNKGQYILHVILRITLNEGVVTEQTMYRFQLDALILKIIITN